MTAYIWDLDGTLLDSYGVIVAAARGTAAAAGLDDPEEHVLRAVKQGTVSAYLKDVSLRCGEPAEELTARYRKYTHALDDRITLTEGAKETLERLRRAGAVHFVYTHRGGSSGPILRRLGILDCFREVASAPSLQATACGICWKSTVWIPDAHGMWETGSWTFSARRTRA